ncbi:2-C-methyl-D-erythritol 4-phosphate cytidylyltransferase [Gracilimonas sp.]|uniref:2-C-methyl-D-erythritol 4-phosphate cytidylyltransferase n=1 Tax=Gracilimonas sp. TaxID=1974203 RepID=UPI002871CBA1|nr:2-C-methyl-D-erythritol 4-phosphate cytidylyltransferase [Gracilimonas sp.]
MSKLSVIIPAAGSGKRMGTETPKPFLKVGGKPILQHTIVNFVGLPQVSQIIIAASSENFSEVESICSSFTQKVNYFVIVEGGSERQQSIENAIQKVGDDIDLVAIHDAVRPFIRASLINKACEVAEQVGGAVIGIPSKDTIKQVDEDLIIKLTPDRASLWQAQTPQVFKTELLKKAYSAASNFVGTDDASLVERIGGTVKMIEGGPENIKITYPFDLKVAASILEGNHE